MRTQILAFSLLLTFCSVVSAQAQQIQVSRENRAIAVSATETVEATADIAVVSIGYHNYGETHDAAYDDNLRAAEKIVNALLAAGVSKARIRTRTMSLITVRYPVGTWTPEEHQQRKFEATQVWSLRLPADTAQKYVDVAIQAGANQLQNIDWQMADPNGLEAKADAAALSRAQAIAESMAVHLRVKLGELIFASNQDSAFGVIGGVIGGVPGESAPPPPPPNLKLFPKKVSQSGSVYAVFAIQ